MSRITLLLLVAICFISSSSAYGPYDSYHSSTTTQEEAEGSGALIGSIIGAIILISAIIGCCCCCCVCCPCYHWCHRNSTNVTIVQPPGGNAGNMQNNFNVVMPTQAAPSYACPNTGTQQAPPQYTV